MVKTHSFFLLIVTALSISFYSHRISRAQELKANVTVDFTRIPIDRREDILTMQQDVMRYLNNQSFTQKEYKNEADKLKWKDEPVEVDVSITIESRSGNSYTAQLLITGRRSLYGEKGRKTVSLLILDKQWGFEYFRGAELSYNSFRFDHFTSLLDFYVFILLGMDLDSYYELGGSVMYQRAEQIWRMGNGAPNASGYQQGTEPGAINRYNLIQELNDVRYDEFRKILIDYYVNGLDGLQENKSKSLDNIYDAVSDLVRFKDKMPNRSVLMQVFFDTKYREFCDVFRGTPQAEKVFPKLKYLDLSHGQVYEQARQGKQ